jgi:hypothetical protein
MDRSVVDSWLAGGAAAPWQGPVVTLASATGTPAGAPVVTPLSGQVGRNQILCVPDRCDNVCFMEIQSNE